MDTSTKCIEADFLHNVWKLSREADLKVCRMYPAHLMFKLESSNKDKALKDLTQGF